MRQIKNVCRVYVCDMHNTNQVEEKEDGNLQYQVFGGHEVVGT